MDLVKHFLVIDGKRKQFLFFFSDSNEHIKIEDWCLSDSVQQRTQFPIGGLLWASSDVQGRLRMEPSFVVATVSDYRGSLPRGPAVAFPLTFLLSKTLLRWPMLT